MASKYEEFFREADKDGSGFLSFDELVAILRKIGYTQPESRMKRMFTKCDTSGDSKISLEEFLKEMGQEMEHPEQMSQVEVETKETKCETGSAASSSEVVEQSLSKYEQFFRDADKDGSGFLSYDELVAMLRKVGYAQLETKIKRMFARCDTSGDGKISLEEYLKEMGQDMRTHSGPELESKCEAVVTTTTVYTEKTERTLSKYEQFFRDADTDGSGFLSFDELVAILRKLGYAQPESKIKLMFVRCDTSCDGKISLEEFLREMCQEQTEQQTESQLEVEEKCEAVVTQTLESGKPHSKYEQFFREADKDGSGFLSFDELVSILRKIGYTEPESRIKLMFKKCDTSADGKISLEEFLKEMEERSS